MAELKPILTPGATSNDELALVAERGYIGIEAFDDTDKRGINAVCEWTRNHNAVALDEHDAQGLHSTPKIARGLVSLSWDPSSLAYSIHRYSYLGGVVYEDDTSIFSVAIISDGVFDLSLGTAMPTSEWTIDDCSEPEMTSGTWNIGWVTGVAASTTKIRVTRRAATSLPGGGYHGPCQFRLIG